MFPGPDIDPGGVRINQFPSGIDGDFFFFWWAFFALIFIGVRWSRPKSGMKNCNLLNRIVPQVFQGLRNFTNESAENLGTKLRDGHKAPLSSRP